MTEEMIVNGVDVSDCEYNENGICCKYIDFKTICEQNDTCDYKQLKRIEIENAELKEILSKEPKAMQAFQIAYSGLKKDNEVLWGMVKDYKAALEEIKKISKIAFSVCDDDCGNANKFMDIINKVSEVLKDE